jgi:osmotically-inducible protein OsmY
MRDMREEPRTTWRSEDDRDIDRRTQSGFGTEDRGQFGYESGRYNQGPYGQGMEGQGGYGYGQGNSGYGQGYQGQGSWGTQGYQSGYGSQGGFGQRSFQGTHGYGRGVGRSYGFGDETESWRGYQQQGWSSDPGRFAGRGPKGYRRSDERIREDVSDRLTDDAWLDASEVEVRTEAGMVTLTGNVKSREDKRRAEDLAMSISGVKDVINQIHVDQGIFDQVADAVTGKDKVTTAR